MVGSSPARRDASRRLFNCSLPSRNGRGAPGMADQQDTELLLALLASSLTTPVTDQALLLDALIEAEGDVERAAKLLDGRVDGGQGTSSTSQGVKRKRAAGLDGWLVGNDTRGGSKALRRDVTPPRRAVDESIASSSSASTTPLGSPAKSESTPTLTSPRKVKAVTRDEFMSILRPPNSSDAKTPGPPKFPPLTLTTPAMVAKLVLSQFKNIRKK